MEYKLARQTVITGTASPGTDAFTQALEIPPDEFVSAIKLLAISATGAATATATLEGSNDGTTWNTLGATTSTSSVTGDWPKVTSYEASSGEDLSAPWRIVRVKLNLEAAGVVGVVGASVTTAKRRVKRR